MRGLVHAVVSAKVKLKRFVLVQSKLSPIAKRVVKKMRHHLGKQDLELEEKREILPWLTQRTAKKLRPYT